MLWVCISLVVSDLGRLLMCLLKAPPPPDFRIYYKNTVTKKSMPWHAHRHVHLWGRTESQEQTHHGQGAFTAAQRTHSREVSSTNVVGGTGAQDRKNETAALAYTTHKNAWHVDQKPKRKV